MAKRASMSDVARVAGVSLTTASRALSGVGRVAAETLAKVIETAERLQFEPDMIARSFVTGRSFIVGVLAERAYGRFSTSLIVGATNYLGHENIAAVTLDAHGTSRVLNDYLKRLRSRRIDGLVVGDDPNRASWCCPRTSPYRSSSPPPPPRRRRITSSRPTTAAPVAPRPSTWSA